MKLVNVRFEHDCGDDRAGTTRAVDATRATRLIRTGYAVLVDDVPEAATTTPVEDASNRGGRRNRGTLRAEAR
jgi:hypothetical protein